MAIVNTETGKAVTYSIMLEERILKLRHAIELALRKGQPAAVASLDRQLAGAMIALRRESRRLQSVTQ